MLGQQLGRHAPRMLQQRAVFVQVGKTQQGVTALARAHELARAADLEVAACDLEAVGRLGHGFQPCLAGLAQGWRVEEYAHAGDRTAADTPAQLVQLAQAEALGMFDHHQARVGHVDADLDHGGRDQHAHRAAGEQGHHGRLLGRRHAPVQQADHPAGQRGAQLGMGLGRVLQVDLFALVDQRAHPVHLAPTLDLVVDARDHVVAPVVGEDLGHHRRAAWRQLVDGAHVEVGEVRHCERARDRRGAHHQQVRLERLPLQLVAQRQPLRHAEAVLLVDDGQPELREHHVVLDHGVGADDEHRLARRHLLEHARAALALAAAGEPGHRHAERLEPLHELAKVLLGQDLGGRHQRALPAGVDGLCRGECGDHRLARSHVALQQAVHRVVAREIACDLVAHPLLRGGERERQRGAQPGVQRAAAELRDVQHRSLEQGTFVLRLGLGQLLRQQLVELQPLPRRVAAVFDRGQRHRGRRLVQQAKCVLQHRQPWRQHVGRQQLVERRALQRRRHRLAQVGLRKLRAGRVDGRQRLRQWRAFGHRLEGRMHHLAPEETDANLAADAHALARREGLLLRGVEVQEAQHEFARGVGHAHHQLSPRALLDAAVAHDALDLDRLALVRAGDRLDERFVFVAHRQVQREVDVALQPEPLHRTLRAGLLCGGGAGHVLHCLTRGLG